MQYTMRSAFKQWLILHNKNYRHHMRVPNWFERYIRNDKDWSYIVDNEIENYYCNKYELTYEDRRRYKGHYILQITDEELLKIESPYWL